MDLVSYLFSFVSIYRIFSAGNSAINDISQIPMQLDGGVLRPRETSAAEDTHRHLEIPAELLAHDIGRHFRSPEHRMQARINRHGFVDAVAPVSVVIPLLQLGQRDLVRAVSINFVRRSKAQRRFAAKVTGGDENIHGAAGIDVKIVVW